MATGVSERVARFIREHDLIPPAGEVTCLVSGGADSTCLWHVLRGLGYAVSAVHVDHRQRGAESDADARQCRELMKAEILTPGDRVSRGAAEAALREFRYRLTEGRG